MKARLLLLLAPALFLATAAGAGVEVGVEFQHAPEGAAAVDARKLTPRSNSAVTGLWKVVVDANADSSLRTFEVAILSTDPAIPSPQKGKVSRSYSVGAKRSDEITMEWDTNMLTPNNGLYEIFSGAESHVGNREEARVTQLKVNNAPAAPTGLEVHVVNNVPVLTWNRSAEPDIIHYTVLRSRDGGAYQEAGSPTSPRFEDVEGPKGPSLTYRVSAVRRSPVNPSGVVSSGSGASSALVLALPGADLPQSSGIAPSPVPSAIEPKHRGFRKTLPYQGLPPSSEGAGNSDTSILAAPARLIESTVRKLPYLAAGFLMLVAALHLMRVATKLARS